MVVYAKDAVKLYVNGTLTATADNTESLTEILGTDSILQIGKANLKTDEYYQGLMDEFTVYNYALDESTIQNMDAHLSLIHIFYVQEQCVRYNIRKQLCIGVFYSDIYRCV